MTKEINLKIYEESLLVNYADNMADMARKWGRKALDGTTISFRPEYIGLTGDLELVASPDVHNQTVIVTKASRGSDTTSYRPENRNMAMLPARRIITEDKVISVTDIQPGLMIWQTDLSLIDVTRIMLDCDSKARENGWMIDKKRIPLPDNEIYTIPQLRKVAEVFADQGSLLPLLDGAEPEDELEKFDHPEELEVRIDPYTGLPMGLIKRADRDYFERWDQILNDILIELNLTTEEILQGLQDNPKEFMPILLNIRKTIEERMRNTS